MEKGGPWRPWRTLREHEDIGYELVDLPDGCRAICAHRGTDRVILVNRALDPAERLAALTHELVHLERGGGCHQAGVPELLRPAIAREEAAVDGIACDRILPPTVLAAFVARRSELEPITDRLVADELDVSLEVAGRALRRLRAQRGAA